MKNVNISAPQKDTKHNYMYMYMHHYYMYMYMYMQATYLLLPCHGPQTWLP